MFTLNTIALIIAIIMFIVGIVGTILPALPGAILVFAGSLVYGFMTDFQTLGIYFYVVQGLLLLLTFLTDFLVSAASTKRFGGSNKAAWGAAIGTLLGIIVLGPIGILLGPFVGATIAELLNGINIKKAVRSGIGSVIGAIGGTFFKLIVEIIMVIYFFVSI